MFSAHNFICFYTPFFSKTIPFFIRANRTISLFSIFPIQKMTFWAMSLHGIFVTYRIAVTKSIFSWCNKFQVFRINAIPVSTNMIYIHSFWNISVSKKICNSVCSSSFFYKIKRTISIFIKRICPKMTFSNLFPFCIKSSFRCVHVSQCTPLMYMCQ